MSLYAESGFVACRRLDGGHATQKTFAVSASTNQAYFLGDAVTLNTSGKVAPISSSKPLLGVITALYSSSNGKPKPLTFAQPTGGPYLTSGQAGFACVNISNAQTYVAKINATGNEALIGGQVKVSAGTPNTAAGLSGQNLGATVTTSADGANAHFQIIGLAPVEMLLTRTSAATKSLVEVKPVNGIFGGYPV